MIDRILGNDKNADGKISKDEAHERLLPMFETADADNDGQLSRNEIKAAVDKRMAGRMAGRRRTGGERGVENPGSGLDRFGNGRSEGGGLERLVSMMPMMRAIDKDCDNELSADEIANAVAALRSLDKNNDGKLSPEELMPGIPQRGRGQLGRERGERRGAGNRPKRPRADDQDGDA
jgi:Ca2+-binding EF-hand superfamily protein